MIKIVDDITQANCITHSGTMHADEVFATAFLALYLKDIKVFRTPEVKVEEVPEGAYLYDIGGQKFDHHQADALLRENGIKYSSFGLLWKELGREYLKEIPEEEREDVFVGIDKELIEGIDAIDNGTFPNITANYKVKTISDAIKWFNPAYASKTDEKEQFLKAVEVAKMIFLQVQNQMIGKQKAKKKVLEALANVQNHILILEEYMPYEEVVLSDAKGKEIYFVIFPSNRGGYAIKTIPKSVEDKTARIDFPKEWGGFVGKELEEKTKIKGSLFCHSNLFLFTCTTKEVAITVANKVIAEKN